jgi:hypothetical protein
MSEKLLSGYLDAKSDYGAAGDGVTDDTDALQQLLLDARTQGKTAFLPPGTYLISHPLVVVGATHITGSTPYNSGQDTSIKATGNFNTTWNYGRIPVAMIQSGSYAPDPLATTLPARWNSSAIDYCHYLKISNINIHGSPLVHGIAIYNPGETCCLDRVHIQYCMTGLYLTGTGASFSCLNCMIDYSADYAVRIMRHPLYTSQPSIGMFRFIAMSGDDNCHGFFYTDEGATIVVVGLKMEGPHAATDVVLFWGVSSYTFRNNLPGFGGSTSGNFSLISAQIQGQVRGSNDYMDAIVRISKGKSVNRNNWSIPGIYICGVTMSSINNVIIDETFNNGVGRTLGRNQSTDPVYLRAFLAGEPFYYSTCYDSGAFKSASKHVFLGGPIIAEQPVMPGRYTVAQVRQLATSGFVSGLIYVTDALKIGEAPGAGTGCLAYSDGAEWKRVSDDAVVVA